MRLSVHLLATSDGRSSYGVGAHDAGPTELGALLERLASTVETEVNRAEINRRRAREPAREVRPTSSITRGRAPLSERAGRRTMPRRFRLFEAAAAAEPDNPTFLGAACEALAGQRIAFGLGAHDRQRLRAFPRHAACAALLSGTRMLETVRCSDSQSSAVAIPTSDTGSRGRRSRAIPIASIALVSAANVTRNWSDAERGARLHAPGTDRAQPCRSASSLHAMTGLAALDSADGLFEDALVWARRAFAVNPNHAAMHWQLISRPCARSANSMSPAGKSSGSSSSPSREPRSIASMPDSHPGTVTHGTSFRAWRTPG